MFKSNPKVKAYLSKINFLVGRNPSLQKRSDWENYIPEPFKSVVIISADFELAWAWRYTKSSPNPLQKTLDKAKVERDNMPKILALCERFDIPITWLTVGHLFLENCTKSEGVAHPDLPRPSRFENKWWRFLGNDWFEYDPGTNFKIDPLWYCPDLIEMIVNSKVNHEIGCHTFSHIDCRNEVCTPENFRREIIACQQAAKRFGVVKMESFVHPGHIIGNLNTLAEMGFTSFRTDNANILGYPSKHKNGLWEFSTTLEFIYEPTWSISSQISKYISTFKRAIKNNAVAYMWFHPSFNPIFVEQIMPSLFEWINEHRDEVWIVNKGDYVKWLNKNK